MELAEARGQVTVRRIAARLVVTHRGGPLTIESVAGLKLNSRGSNVDAEGHARSEHAADAGRRAAGVGAVGGRPKSNPSNTRINIDDARGRAQAAAARRTVGGSATLAGVASELRVDARDTRLVVGVDKPAPIAIYTEGDDPLTVTLPRSGFELEALAIDGRLTVPEGLPPK